MGSARPRAHQSHCALARQGAAHRTEIISAFATHVGRALDPVDEIETDDPDIAWNIVARLPALSAPVIIWCERAQPTLPDELGNLPKQKFHWVIGCETLLSSCDPLTDFLTLTSVVAGALHDVPAVLDVNTTRWYTRRELDEIFDSEEVEPPAEVLWITHLVRSDPENGDAKSVWIHTHGLWRCGLPELEMIGVPEDSMSAAAELVNDVAALLMEQPPPPAGAPFEIGTDLHIALQRWQDVIPTLDDITPGGARDRECDVDHAHTGVRAVICELDPSRAPSFNWPHEVIDRLVRDEAGVYMTTRATERQGKLARASWDQLATAFASVRDLPVGENGEPRMKFGVKAGFRKDDDDGGREHLWFEALTFECERVEGKLVNQPLAITQLTRGDRTWIDRDQVSDWIVVTPTASFRPTDVAAMWRAVDEIKQKSSAS